jgi:hypothetical protein
MRIEDVKGVGFQLFVGTKEPKALAGCFARSEGLAQVWMLPFADLNIAAWVEVALKQWHKLDPERFPVDFGWEREPAWMTPAEAELAERIGALQKERQDVLARLEVAERELKAELHAVSLSADAGERRLLTEQGDSLAEAVARAFEGLGFGVQDMDKIFPSNDRREDLRISLPGNDDWTAICEVKGYYKGASVNDLLRVERFRGRFYKEKGRDPDRCWYVANCFLKDDPSRREKPLAKNAPEVETFAEEGGLVIGTVELFQLLMEVRKGRVEASEARRMLMEQVGYFALESGEQQGKAG